MVEFSSEVFLQKAIDSTAGDGVVLGAAAAASGKAASDAAQRDRAAADERKVSNC